MTATSNIERTHTAGPWVWERYANGDALVSETARSGTVRKVVNLGQDGPDRTLAAAAPELLDALLQIANRNIGDSVVMRRLAKNALAKLGVE